MNAPLAGMGIVITRPASSAQALAKGLEALGARAFIFPALAIEPLGDDATLAASLDRLPHADWAIFVSANAVEVGLPLALRRGPWPAATRVAAIGDATAAALREAGLADVVSPAASQDSEGLLAMPQLRDVHGQAVLVFRGVGGRERLAEGLTGRGARVHYVECYRRTCPPTDAAPLAAAWSRGEIQAVSALSAETLDNFMTLVANDSRVQVGQATLLVPHPAVAAAPAARRFARVLVAGPGAEGIAQALTTRP